MPTSPPAAQWIIDHLGLQPHPTEGGWFLETYRCPDVVGADALPPRYPGARSVSTAIYYLLTPDTVSALHRLASDEVFHFYLGDPVEQLQLYPDGSHQMVTLGNDLVAGEQVQSVVPAGTWQGARLVPGGDVALLGCTVAPGFDFNDYQHGNRADLCRDWPQASELIASLTP
ncbi:cupin domain-containing protein [Roseospirillum parvum]|uniref:DUF985 domain-containing protein n=1 Tax=Roseospirillum parvum TaxID=83401 RepID=A0A1G7W433_9PROT|nr:cupin domain-containing protein [Roseospirillum parvum]SDG66683.1 hypothetical protein SAMN05421742_10271 [Roseospirillum parvum]